MVPDDRDLRKEELFRMVRRFSGDLSVLQIVKTPALRSPAGRGNTISFRGEGSVGEKDLGNYHCACDSRLHDSERNHPGKCV